MTGSRFGYTTAERRSQIASMAAFRRPARSADERDSPISCRIRAIGSRPQTWSRPESPSGSQRTCRRAQTSCRRSRTPRRRVRMRMDLGRGRGRRRRSCTRIAVDVRGTCATTWPALRPCEPRKANARIAQVEAECVGAVRGGPKLALCLRGGNTV